MCVLGYLFICCLKDYFLMDVENENLKLKLENFSVEFCVMGGLMIKKLVKDE